MDVARTKLTLVVTLKTGVDLNDLFFVFFFFFVFFWGVGGCFWGRS